MSLIRCLCLALGAASATGCVEASDGRQLVVLDFAAESDPGTALEGVSVTVDGMLVGQSDAMGSLHATIYAKLGQRIRIEYDCPQGYRAPAEPKMLRLGHYRSIDGASPPPIQLAIRCPPTNRLAVIVVRADNGAGLAVLLNERVMTRTNAAGVAHFSTSAPPGTELTVRLDTSEQPSLVPRNPMRILTMPDVHEVFVIEQTFETAKRHLPKRKKRPRITKIE
ncbi:MAG: hypothetical protein WAU39_07860 [Polyangiales bacterium]